MTDPQRLLDDPDGSPLGRSLLASACGDAPETERRGVIAKRLGIAASLLTASTATSAATAALWWKLGLLVIAASGAAIAVVAQHDDGPEWSAPMAPAPSELAWHEPQPAPAPASSDVAISAHMITPEPASPSPLATPPVTPRPKRVPRVAAPPPVPPPPAVAAPSHAPVIDARRLAAEVAVLDRARAALRSGDVVGALGALDEHTRTFADGALLAEAEVIRIEALFQRGDRPEAVGRARAFLSTFPYSPHAKRVRSLLERAVTESP